MALSDQISFILYLTRGYQMYHSFRMDQDGYQRRVEVTMHMHVHTHRKFNDVV